MARQSKQILSKTQPPGDPTKPTVTNEQERYKCIAEKAYELYESQGRMEGHDLDHWLQAEAQLNPKVREMPPTPRSGSHRAKKR